MNALFRSGLYRQGRDVIWYQRAPDITAMNLDPVVDQLHFAWGDPGTESGHSLDANDTDRTVALDGTGNYLAFLRFELDQTRSNADQNLTMTFKHQFQVNGGGYGDVTASSTEVQVVADSNIADGAATTDRISGSSATFLAGEYDEGDGVFDAISWTISSLEHTELLSSLVFIDSALGAGDVVDFRIVESDNTLLDTYSVANATLTWNAPVSGDDDLIAAATHAPPNTLLRM